MTTPVPPLKALHVFDAVMRSGGIGRAAERLGVTHGAVSRQIAGLQRSLAHPLFEGPRNARRPSAEAERLWREIAPAIAVLDEAVARLAGRNHRVRVSCLSTLAARWLIPRLPDFVASAPGTTIDLTESYAALDRSLGGADLAVRMWRPDLPAPDGLKATAFMDNALGLVAAPGLGGATRAIRLVSRSHPQAWTVWSTLTGYAVPVGDPVEFDHQQTMIEAAVAGLGPAIAQSALVEADIAAGRLIAPQGFVADGAVFAAFSRADDLSASGRRFLAWLCDQGGAHGV